VQAEKKRSWLNDLMKPLGDMNVKMGVGAALFCGLLIAIMVWGAANLSIIFVGKRGVSVSLTDAATAMFRFGVDRRWDGIWSPEIEAALPSLRWYLGFLALEILGFVAVFWPLWRFFAPRVPDPMVVGVIPLPIAHPKADKRRVAREKRQQRWDRLRGSGGASIAPPPISSSDVQRVLIDTPIADRLILGKMGESFVTADRHQSVVVFGPRQPGVTSGILAPSIAEWSGPVVVSSPRLTDLANVWAHRASAKSKRWLFDPTWSVSLSEPIGPGTANATRTVRPSAWSPLSFITDITRGRHEPLLDQQRKQWVSARRISQWMVAGAMPPDDSGPFNPTTLAAEHLLAPMLFVAAVNNVPMFEVAQWVNSQDLSGPSLLISAVSTPEVVASWSGALSQPEASRAAGLQLLSVVMYPYGDPSVSSLGVNTEIPISQLFDGEANTLFVTTPPEHQARLRPVTATIVAEVVDTALNLATKSVGNRVDPPLLVVFDEAGSFAPIPTVEQIAAVGSDLGIQLVTGFHDLGQAVHATGSERGAKRLIDSHRSKIVLPGISDSSTIEHLGPMLSGSYLLGVEPGRRNPDAELLADDDQPNPLVATPVPGWLRTLQDGEAIAIHDNLPPMKLTLRNWDEYGQLRAPFAGEESGADKLPWWALWRRLRRNDQSTHPGPFNSEANDREADRYWDAIEKSHELPEPLPYQQGTNIDP